MTGLVARGRAAGERGVGGRRRRDVRARGRRPRGFGPGQWSALVLACCLAAVIAVLFGRLDGEFQSIGNRQVPEVDAATGMYFSLNDMDAQVGERAAGRGERISGR